MRDMTVQEFWDLIDAEGRPLGMKIEKGTSHPLHTYHLVIGVWVIAPDGTALITKRQAHKAQYPNLWENTGGCVRAGESGPEGAARELKEETGIQVRADELRLLGTVLEKTALVQIYGFRIQEIPQKLALQKEEVSDAKWVTRNQWEYMIQRQEVSAAALGRMRAVQGKLEKMGFN